MLCDVSSNFVFTILLTLFFLFVIFTVRYFNLEPPHVSISHFRIMANHPGNVLHVQASEKELLSWFVPMLCGLSLF